MKISKIFTPALLVGGLASLTMVGCYDAELYNNDAPSWMNDSIKAAAERKAANTSTGGNELVGMMEDVYTIGNTDYSSGWWSSWSKYYVIPKDTTWNAQFNLNISSDDQVYYHNFALIITNDVDRGGTGYTEYGAIRYDYTEDSASYNSLWGSHLFFKYSQSDLIFAPADNKTSDLTKLAGKVTLSVTRATGKFQIVITNGTATKTYSAPYDLPNLNADAENTNIRCFLVPEGSYIDFLATNIEPIGGATSANDKQPVSMVLNGVPLSVEIAEGLTADSVLEKLTATVTFEEGVTKEVTLSDLVISVVPDLTEVGTKTVVAVYPYTFKGEATSTPAIASAQFELTNPVVGIKAVYNGTDYVFENAIVDPALFSVTAVYADNTEGVLESDKCTYSYSATNKAFLVTFGDVASCTVDYDKVGTVTALGTSDVKTPTFGLADFTNGWWPAVKPETPTNHFYDLVGEKVEAGKAVQFTMTVTSLSAENWQAPCVVLKNDVAIYEGQTEYGVVRPDNFGWGTGYDGNAVLACDWNWDTYKAGLNNSTFVVTVFNYGGGKACIRYDVTYESGEKHLQTYNNMAVDSDNLYATFVTEESYAVFK